MNRPYGPWATLISAGQNPQLSAFWRRRMGMLVAVSKTKSALSRRSASLLVATAILLLLLPTVRSTTSADAADKPPAAKNAADSSQVRDASSPAPGEGQSEFAGGVTLNTGNGPPLPKGFIQLPVYHVLNAIEDRQQFQITAAEEKKLREIAANFDAESQKAMTAFNDEANKLRSDKRQTLIDEWPTKQKQRRAAARRQIEQALTAPQLAAVRRREMIEDATSIRYTGERLGLELTKHQIGQLDALAERAFQGPDESRAYRGKVLRVLTPQQREKLMRQAADPHAQPEILMTDFRVTTVVVLDLSNGYLSQADPDPDDWLFSSAAHDPSARFPAELIVCPLLASPGVQQEIGLTADELAKLKEISDRMKEAAQRIFVSFGPEQKIERLPPKEQQAKRADRERQLQALGKDTLRQIHAALTPAESAALEKIAAEIKATTILKYGPGPIPLTPEQRAQINRLRDEEAEILGRLNKQYGEKVLKALTPAQVARFTEVLDQNEGW